MIDMRNDNRQNGQIRQVKIEKDYTMHAEGSVLYCQGNTKVLCNATVEDKVPHHVFGTGRGWVTAEYSMLPRATATRNQRDISKLKLSPRSTEIQRLIGRALRGAVDLEKLGERSIIIDCDVIQADGGTRCASITGGFIALSLAINKLMREGVIKKNPITKQIAAISVGMVDDTPVCDLCYEEDCRAQTDMNVIMTSNGGFIEVQGTAEGQELTKPQLSKLLELAEDGCNELFVKQRIALLENIDKSFLVATNNAHKLEEFGKIFSKLGFSLITPKMLGIKCDPDETGATFEENSMIKARAFFELSGIPTVADDSGLCVDALGGEPGIFSARYGGFDDDKKRLDFLLSNMKDKTDRSAHFACAIACILKDGSEFTVRENAYGTLIDAPRGECGFGYDPIFVPDGYDKSYAELPPSEKNKISHRAKALAAFAEKIKEIY